jgi:pSer/pThr/pTyr-binding forkhead associated (FHA) protein
MDFIERFQLKFGRWCEHLFNDSPQEELRPKDVLRKIINAMEEHRNEGFDGKLYVPNKYVLEISISDPDERDYLFSFLDEEELIDVLKRYMSQNGYSIRGALEFTIVDVDQDSQTEKIRIKARYEKSEPPPRDEAPSVSPSPSVDSEKEDNDDDLLTIAQIPDGADDDELTVAAVPKSWAALLASGPDNRRKLITISKEIFYIGRSRQLGNDLTLAGDGLVSKRHARIERERDGLATIYDLQSTNGILLNGKTVQGSATLKDGDEIVIGSTKLLFQQEAERKPFEEEPFREAKIQTPETAPSNPGRVFIKRAKLRAASDDALFPVASETLIGKAITCDIVLSDSDCRPQQALIVAPDGENYYLQDISGKLTTLLNDHALYPEEKIRLRNGDTVQFGETKYVFELSERQDR